MGTSELFRSFNRTVKDYFVERNEEIANNLLKLLQKLTVSANINMFDPGSRETVDFFVNLYELMNMLDGRSNITWAGIIVLEEACRHPSTRDCLIHSLKFVPILTKALETKPIGERKVKILQLIQELTYGIKISWQEAHLSFLISCLTKMVTGEEPELIPLALGILVNLCYKNLAAVYTLMQSVDIKPFLKVLLRIQNNSTPTKVQVCKLLIILEGVSGGVSDIVQQEEVYIRSTCHTLTEAINLSNSRFMRHVISFFKEIVTTDRASKVISNYPDYAEDIEKLLNAVKEKYDLDGDCLAALFEYLSCVIDLEVFGLESLFPQFLKLAFSWIESESASSEALTLISKIVAALFSKADDTIPVEKVTVIESVHMLIQEKIPDILLLLDLSNGSQIRGNELHSHLTSLILLLLQLVRAKRFSELVIRSINESALRKLFEPLLIPSFKENNLFQQEIYKFYIEALCFLSDLADRETSWLLLYNELLQEKQVQMALSIALYTGSEHMKRKVLTLTGTTGFSAECLIQLASRLTEINSLVCFSPLNTIKQENLNTSSTSPFDLMPMLTITQKNHLNSVLEKCEEVAKKNESSITSSVIELYHYKISLLNQNLRQMQMSQEAADQRSSRLQHNLLQIGSEVNRLHQLLHGTQQSLEFATNESASLAAQLNTVRAEAQDTHNKYSEALQNLRSKTVIITDLNKEINDFKSNISSLSQKCSDLTDELSKNKDVMKKTVSNLESQLESGRKQLETKAQEIDSLKKEIAMQSSSIQKLEKLASEKDNHIAELNKELNEQRRMREIISELAMGKRKLDGN